MAESRLEQALRRTLAGRAEDAEGYGEFAAGARAEARRRRRTRRTVTGMVAGIAVLVGVWVTHPFRSGTDTASPDPPPSPGVERPDVDMSGWRVESYHGVQLRVPPNWGWGGIPSRSTQGITYCGVGAYAYPTPEGTAFEEDRAMPYVGRGGYTLTDYCLSGPRRSSVEHPFVWFDSYADEGSAELPNGFRRVTVDVAGVRVSVAHDHPDKLAAIVGSIQQVDQDSNGCPAWDRLPDRWGSLDNVEHLRYVGVCVYRQRFDSPDEVALGYSTRVAGADGDRLLDRLRQPVPVRQDCRSIPDTALDTVVLWFQDRASAVDVQVDLGDCGRYVTANGERGLAEPDVSLWAVDGVPLYAGSDQVGNALTGLQSDR